MSRYVSRTDHEELMKRLGTPPKIQGRILTFRDVFTVPGYYRLKRRNKHCIDITHHKDGGLRVKSADPRFQQRFPPQKLTFTWGAYMYEHFIRFGPADIPALIMFISATGGVLKVTKLQ